MDSETTFDHLKVVENWEKLDFLEIPLITDFELLDS